MTTYKVLRPVEAADLDMQHRLVEVLKAIPNDGYVKSGALMRFGKERSSKGLAHACARGILKRIPPHERILGLDSVKFWRTQINKPHHKNTTPRRGTRELYLGAASKFDEWMAGRTFPSRKAVIVDGLPARQEITMSFENIGDLLKYCRESDYGTGTAQRVMREYMTVLQENGASFSAYLTARSAIKSYFDAHDIMLDMRKTRKYRAEDTEDNPVMSLEDFYKMLQNGKPSITVRTVMLTMLQFGMDAATLADRFNYDGYPQIVRHFKTVDRRLWDLGLCPVPIKLVRVKTGVRYTTFIDHDAVVQLQEYLAWKEARYGIHDGTKPLFMTKQNTPIHSEWVSKNFSEVAVRAGIQEKVSHRACKIHSHAVRYLLKSTLRASGCAQYAAEHVLGHAPRDAYEKEAILRTDS